MRAILFVLFFPISLLFVDWSKWSSGPWPAQEPPYRPKKGDPGLSWDQELYL